MPIRTTSKLINVSASSSIDTGPFNAVLNGPMTALGTSSGSTAGGDLVVLTGTGFSDVEQVSFGDVAVYDFVINSDNQLTVVSPRSSPLRTKYAAAQCAWPTWWWAEWTRVTWWAWRARRGRCSHI